MEIVKPFVEIKDDIYGEEVLRKIEGCARVCYKSEHKVTEDSARKFVWQLIRSGHLTPLEHVTVTVMIVCDRGISHELVRHRLMSVNQESTRFCDYHKSGIQFIEPAFDLCAAYDVWEKAMKQAESAYLRLRAMGISPELARAVLPNALKTELYITANLRELRHILQLRAAGTTGKPHPQMQALMRELLKKLKAAIPVVFDDIYCLSIVEGA